MKFHILVQIGGGNPNGIYLKLHYRNFHFRNKNAGAHFWYASAFIFYNKVSLSLIS